MATEKRWEGTTVELFYSQIGINWVGYLGDGKIALVDKKEKDSLSLDPGIPYISFVKKELENVAFVNIISEAFIPRIIILPEKILVVTKDDDEKAVHTYFEKMDEVVTFLAEKHIERTFMFIRYLDEK